MSFLGRAEPFPQRRFAPGRFLAKAALSLLVLLAVAVLAMRWLPPPTSAFMLGAEFAAWREGRR